MDSLELFLIVLVICFQVYVFISAWKQIHSVENFLTDPDGLKLYEKTIEIIETDGEDNPDGLIRVSAIRASKEESNGLLSSVIDTINNYLQKNKGGAADFNLIKDIVERQCDTIDEEINHKLPVPIYLGLMGTVMGIIIGLFSLKFEFNPETQALDGELFVYSVSSLISGVKLAMICSLVGLLMTTILSSLIYREAKAKLERQKNEFYNFIQTQLLPQMSKDAASTILALQANLERFNSSFNKNIEGFGNIMDDIHEAFDSQVQLQKEMKKMDLAQVAHLNVNVLAQLRASMGEFEKFTQYLSQMNSFVRQTAKLTDSINDQLQRTEAVETVVDSLEDNIQKNQLVMEKLRQFLERIDEQSAVMEATGELDSAISRAIGDLRSHTEQQIKSIRDYTTEATADLKELVNSERGHLRNLDKLGQLDNMSKLIAAIETMKTDNRNNSNELGNKILQLSKAISQNTSAQRGDSGIPAWVRMLCVGLFVVLSLLAITFFAKTIFLSEEDNDETTVEQVVAPTNNTVVSNPPMEVAAPQDTTAHIDSLQH